MRGNKCWIKKKSNWFKIQTDFKKVQIDSKKKFKLNEINLYWKSKLKFYS